MSFDAQTESILFRRFDESQHKHFEGRGGRTFTYVPDEAVMARLDEAFGVGGWSYLVEAVSDTVAKGRLIVGQDVAYEDFGYPTNGLEPLKEASGDALRRIGRYIGVARYLYEGQVQAPAGAHVERRPQPVQNGPHAVPAEDAATGPARAVCPLHGVEWRGRPGDFYHRDENGAYCRPEGQPRRRAS